MKSRQHLITSVLSCLFLPALAHAKPPASESDRQQAVEHFKLGNQAFAEGDSLQAYTEYTAAWSLHESFDIACNLGRTEAELGKARDAAEHLAYCLDNFSASARPEMRSAEGKLREVFADVQKRVTSLTLRVEPDGAVVRLDAAIVGKTPLRRELYLDPGQHEVDVRMAGYEAVRRVVNAARGERQELLLELAPRAGEASATTQAAPGAGALDSPTEPAQPASPGSTDDSAASMRAIVLMGAGGLSIVGLGVGFGYWFQARQLDDDARQARRASFDELGPSGCDFDPGASQCVRLNETLDDRDRARTFSALGLAAGGVLALGTVATYLWWPSAGAQAAGSTNEPARVAWAPAAGKSEIGVVIWGSL